MRPLEQIKPDFAGDTLESSSARKINIKERSILCKILLEQGLDTDKEEWAEHFNCLFCSIEENNIGLVLELLEAVQRKDSEKVKELSERISNAFKAQIALAKECGQNIEKWVLENGACFGKVIDNRQWWLERLASSEEGKEQEICGRLREDLVSVAAQTGANLSEEEAEISVKVEETRPFSKSKPKDGEQINREKIIADIAYRAANLKMEIEDAENDKDKEREAGAKRLVLRAAYFAATAPRISELLLEYARMLKEKLIDWKDIKEPDEYLLTRKDDEKWFKKEDKDIRKAA